MQPENNRIKEERFINIRKLAALDIVFHGSRFILAEFMVAVVVPGALGTVSFVAFFRNPQHPFAQLVVGCVLLWIAINYVPMLLYTINIIRGRSAEREVALELGHQDNYRRKYTVQALFLVLPLVIPALAIMQEVKRHARKYQEPST
ncbi:MAG TPA: hypothetical protein VF043_28610 [Ktedonobacteraceae bacterium]